MTITLNVPTKAFSGGGAARGFYAGAYAGSKYNAGYAAFGCGAVGSYFGGEIGSYVGQFSYDIVANGVLDVPVD